MVIFNSYVKLPDGTPIYGWIMDGYFMESQ